jgi:3-oxoacyl-[acyl-carrier protein] reductase
MLGTLSGKTALVTGSSRGIGRAIAMQLAAEGAITAIHYVRNDAAAEQTLRTIEDQGGTAFMLRADLHFLDQIERLYTDLDRELEARTGSAGLDILVSNAGDDSETEFEDTTEELFDHLMTLNVKAPFFLFQHAMKRLRDNGRVVNISSVAARGAQSGRPVYAASKYAANSLVVSLAEKLGPRGISVNTISPGATYTDLSAHILDDAAKGPALKSVTAMRRFAQPDDVADAVSQLVAPKGGWITGQIIEATGGLWL